MDRWKAELGRGREKRRVEERRSETRKGQKKADADARKGRKVAKRCVFPMMWGSGGSKSRLAKAAGAETSGEMRNEKLHAVVARSRFWSENVQNTWVSEHFCKLRCRKSARCCGAKHISKSKSAKNWGIRSTFGRSDVVLHGRRKGLCTLSKVSKTWGFCSNFNYNHHYTTLHSNILRYNYNYTFTTFQYTTLHYTTLHSITLNYTTLHYTTLHYSTLPSTHFTTLHYTTLHNITTTTTQLHSTTLRYTTTTTTATQLHSTTLNYTTLHYTKLHYTTLHYTPLPSTTLNYINGNIGLINRPPPRRSEFYRVGHFLNTP